MLRKLVVSLSQKVKGMEFTLLLNFTNIGGNNYEYKRVWRETNRFKKFIDR